MRSKTFIFILFCLALGAMGTAFLKWRSHVREIELQSRFASQADCIARLSAQRDRMREALARKANNPTTDKNALFRLRAEVAEFRRNTNNLDALRTGLEKVKAEIAASAKGPATNTGPDPSKVRAYWPKDQISFAGYMDRTSAIQSCLWAMSRGEEKTIMEMIDPDSLKELWHDSRPNPSEADKNGTSPDAIAERRSNLHRLAESLAPATGFYLVSGNLIPKMPEMTYGRRAEDCAIYQVYFAGDGATRAISLKRNNDQWKLTAINILGGTEEAPTYDMTLWP
jgi:hypothetical protein